MLIRPMVRAGAGCSGARMNPLFNSHVCARTQETALGSLHQWILLALEYELDSSGRSFQAWELMPTLGFSVVILHIREFMLPAS